MKIKTCIMLLCCSLPTIGNAQENNDSILSGYAKRAAVFGLTLPQEKVFLHIDNSCYFAGDTIWYKGYVTRSDNNKLSDLSNILYVDLLTPDGYLMERQQLEMTDGTAKGCFALNDTIYAGFYELRAYTRWMLNFGVYEHPHSIWTEEMFYNKNMAKDFFRDYEKLYSRVFPIYNRLEDPANPVKNMTLRPMRRYYKGKKSSFKPDVKFFPEGGNMTEGTTSRVAFEINSSEGKHLDATITIYDRNKKEVAKARTVHRGRGYFMLPVAKGEKYTATIECDGETSTVDLPKAQEEGCSWRIDAHDNAITVNIECGTLPPGSNDMAVQVMQSGCTRNYKEVTLNTGEKTSIEFPTDNMKSGVTQLTLFDRQGRIWADRLCFIRKDDANGPKLSIEGMKDEYTPYEEVNLKLRIDGNTADNSSVSVTVRDRSSEEFLYDNGNILTELLLSSELKGFVEHPGYYFEANDSIHTRDLDLLMMVQGWRRYDWKDMAGITPFGVTWMPEKGQTVAGQVNQTISLAPDEEYDPEAIQKEHEAIMKDNETDKSANFNTDPSKRVSNNTMVNTDESFQDQYGTLAGNIKDEVNVLATYIQGKDMVEVRQKTLNGTFFMQSPKYYEDCILFLSAADTTLTQEELAEKQRKDFNNEEAYPDYYVKRDLFYPKFPKPYNYYQDAEYDEFYEKFIHSTASFSDRQLETVTVQSKKGGLRKIDFSKPALTVNAYEAFNLAADYGLNAGTYDWKNFSRQVAISYISDMGMDRRYHIEERYDGRLIKNYTPQATTKDVTTGSGQNISIGIVDIDVPEFSHGGKKFYEDYHKLKNIKEIRIYTDYAPREEGSDKYSQSEQPSVVIDYHRFENEGMQPTYRDRRYFIKGYSICSEFYNPDYSTRPLPDHKDYRRTLYWNPDVKFSADGTADIRFYNNSKKTVLKADAQGITSEGHPLTWNSEK